MKSSTQAMIGAGLSLVLSSITKGQSNWAVARADLGGFFLCDIQRDMVWRWEPQGLHRRFDHNFCHTLVLAYDGRAYGENVGGESRAA